MSKTFITPKFSKTSKAKLATCHPLLQLLFTEVIKYYDCTIIDGRRDEKTQNLYFESKRSQKKFPESKHNASPPALSSAVDAVPYVKSLGGITWKKENLLHFGGFVLGVASRLNISIRWGGDWNCNNDLDDQNFDDLAHFELKGELL